MALLRPRTKIPKRVSLPGLSLAVFSVFLVANCGGDSSSGPDPVDDTITSVSVTPATTTLGSIGATAQLAASGSNAAGTMVSGTTFTWSSSEETVATVSSSGLVTATGIGVSVVTATAAGTFVSASVPVTVQQVVTAVAISPQDGSVEIGETLQLSANATDAGGADVESATFTWSSSDPAISTVSSAGLVMGVSDGAVTITGTSGGVDGTAPVTVIRADLEITQDTNLSGAVEVDDFKVPVGVTVTMTDDLSIDATGYVEILGTLSGDCVELMVQGDTAITVKGTLNNGCAQGAEGEGLTLVADGELTLEDATIISSGEMSFSNDPTLTESDFPDTNPSVGSVGSQDREGPRRAGPGIPYTFVNRTTVRYAGGGTGPYPANNGVNGSDGTAGEDGRPVKMWLRGNAEFAGNTTLWGQDGGQGGNGNRTAVTDVSSTAGKGGSGGRIRVYITGSLTYSGGENVVRSGSGGKGGNAIARALPNDAGNKAPSATATGGDGGIPGLIEIRAGGGVNVANAGALVLEVGLPGQGGDATSTGADGGDALGATVPAQEGGSAAATAGMGGSTPDKQLVKEGNVSGSAPILRGAIGEDLDGGTGGEAFATAGKGGNGIQTNKPGGKGGALSAAGGGGGDALIKGLTGALVGDGGDGGRGVYEGGNGGTGWSDCIPGQPVEAGGKGGDGGSISGGAGTGGQGLAPGARGVAYFENVGNGGDGGAGSPRGEGGDAGTQGTVTEPSTEVDPTFEPGDEGATCPPPTTPERVYLQQEAVPNNGGLVTAGSWSIQLLNLGNEIIGFTQVETYGASGNHFVGFNPDRFGYFGDYGWKVHLDGMRVGAKDFMVQEFQVCYYNTTVSAQNPAYIHQLDAQGGLVGSTTVGSLAAPPAPLLARTGEPAGANCYNVEAVGTAAVILFTGPFGLFADVGGVEGRQGMSFYGYRIPG